MEPNRINVLPDLTWAILRSAFSVHRELGPGLLESTYRACLSHQLRLDGLQAEVEKPIPLFYKGLQLGAPYRADLVIEGKVLVELKVVDTLLPVHSSQTITYLKLARLPVGLLINFNEASLKKGIRRFVNTRETDAAALAAEAPRPSPRIE
jgi:GxxExxY protein